MPANAAKYLLSVGNIDYRNFEVTGFTGEESISGLYRFDIEFRMSDTAKASKTATPDAAILNKPCRLDIERNGKTIPYCGIVVEFRVCDSDDTRYVIRLAPHMYRLTLNSASRIFQNLTVIDIIESIVKEHELKEYFKIELEPHSVKYPAREFRVQHQETDFAFISRLMEESGIWYYFEQVMQPWGAFKERAVITDAFSKFSQSTVPVPFMKGSGLAEITSNGALVESVNRISVKTALMPKFVRVRDYNHHYPESFPDGSCDILDGKQGRVYEYGGSVRNICEAEHRAALSARRLWVQNSCADGKGNCALFRAGLRVPITHSGSNSLSGLYLLISVKHTGGWESGAYVYRNEFTCVRAEPQIYAPPLRTPVPRIDGVTIAHVGTTGEKFPTLNKFGDYNVNMPFVPQPNGRDYIDENGSDYGGSKNIRVAQPSGGASDGKSYGIHFPSKRGAEMVLAYIDGDPGRPVGLGFVPNIAAMSVVGMDNRFENIIRSWGGNELVMADHPQRESIRLSTPSQRSLTLHDDEKLIRIKSADSELLFNDAEKRAEVSAGGHLIGIIYNDGAGNISIKTAEGNIIELNDPGSSITIQNDGAENKVVLNGNDKSITLDSMDNTVVVNGKENCITMGSRESELSVDGEGKKITLESSGSKLLLDGGNNSITIKADNGINFTGGGKIYIDAPGGISTMGQSAAAEKKAADVKINASTAGAKQGASGGAQGSQTPRQTSATVATKRLKRPIVIDRYKMPGLNEDGSDIADDMAFGKGAKLPRPIYSEAVIKGYIDEYQKSGFDVVKHKTFSNNDKNSVDSKAIYNAGENPIGNYRLLGYSDEKLFEIFRKMATEIFTPLSNPMWTNISQMITKFQRNEGGIYENKHLLTNHIRIHPSTVRYCNELDKYIQRKLTEHGGVVEKLEDREVDFKPKDEVLQNVENLRKKKGKDFSLTPVYDAVSLKKLFNAEKWDNTLKGATIALNDIWATEVIITEYELTGSNYNGRYQVTLWDHFGLDVEDIARDKFLTAFEGFYAWFHLQHYRGYRPFITKITFDRYFGGNL